MPKTYKNATVWCARYSYLWAYENKVINSRIEHFRFQNRTAMGLQGIKSADSFASEFKGLLWANHTTLFRLPRAKWTDEKK